MRSSRLKWLYVRFFVNFFIQVIITFLVLLQRYLEDSVILDKLKIVRSKILGKFERLTLFVVIKRVDANLWDFVFAADKLDSPDNLKIIADIIRKELDKNEMINFSRIVLLDSTDSFAKNFNSTFTVCDENGCVTVNGGQINNIRIKEAYLFFSKNS